VVSSDLILVDSLEVIAAQILIGTAALRNMDATTSPLWATAIKARFFLFFPAKRWNWARK